MGAAPDGLRAVDAVPAPRPDAPRLARPRPVRAVRRPRQHAAVLAPPPDRLRRLARRPQVVPAVGQQHARPPRVRPDARRRGDDRSARPGLRQRRRDGHRRAAPGRRVQPRRARPSSITGPTSSPRTATSRRASPPRPRAWPATCGWASSSSSTTTTTSSSTARRRWPGPRTSRSASRRTAGTPSGSTDGNDIDAIEAAIEAAQADDRPSLIAVRTHIGFGSPNKQDSQKAHGAPLGPDEVRLTKEAYGWDPDKTFYVPDDARERLPRRRPRRRRRWSRTGRRRARRLRGRASRTGAPSSGAASRGELPDGWDADLKTYEAGDRDRDAERQPGRDPGPGRARSRSCSAAPPTCPNRT